MTREKFLKIMLEIEEQISLQPYKAGQLVPAENEEEMEEQKELEEKAPPGWEGTVKAMKKHKKITNPWALAWYMKHKGAHPHYKKSGRKKKGKR